MAKTDLITKELLEAFHDELRKAMANGDVDILATTLQSWAEDIGLSVENTWDETIRTTAGEDPIETDLGGVLESIVAKTDFKCTKLRTTAYNQLRLASDGGGAVVVGTGRYFPVPKLTLGQFGDASENNGLLLTDSDGNNITNATVYFKALANGVPNSVTDGVACSSQTVSYGGKSYKVYTTPGPGYLIVSGVTFANVCAHIAWEDWYDKFVSPTDEDDVADSIDLSGLFSAAPNGTGKFLVCGNAATRAERTDDTHMLITDPIGRVTSPSWINTLQEDGETYLHELTISGMKSGGAAFIEGSEQVLSVSDTTVSYSDQNATAISGTVRYEKATAATATVTLSKTAYALNDCGVEMKEGAEGTAWLVCAYTQNVPDALSQIAKVKLDAISQVAGEALNQLYQENVGLKALVAAMMADDEYRKPLESSTAGAPSASNIPTNWNEETMGVWNGCPRFKGQEYIDKASKKLYRCLCTPTNSTADWTVMN